LNHGRKGLYCIAATTIVQAAETRPQGRLPVMLLRYPWAQMTRRRVLERSHVYIEYDPGR